MSENMKKSAFSLAEMMVVMLVVSIVLAAMAPVVTTRMRSNRAASPDGPWYWADPSDKSGNTFTTATKAVIGQSGVTTGSDDNAILVINKNGDDKDDILFKNGDKVIGKIKTSEKPSIAVGSGTATGKYSVAVGFDHFAESGEEELSLASAIAGGDYSIALGGKTTHKYAVAIGYGASAGSDYAIALGSKLSAVDIQGKLDVKGKFTVNGVDVTSDKRLKYIQGENNSGLNKIQQMKVYNFTYKKDPQKEPHIGVMAQELQKILPNAVRKGTDGFLTVRIDDVIYTLVNAVKQLDKNVQTLTKEVKAHDEILKAQNKKLEEISKRLDKLENK